MHTILYVISDLHLGGAPESDGHLDFQICPPNTQTLLANFIKELPSRQANRDVRLVLAGDIVDFLAEEPFQAFTADQQIARKKLGNILDATVPIWDEIRAFVKDRDGAVIFMLGNHDIELSLPSIRRMFLEHIGPGRIEFLYDNEAFTCGPVLIEHGNRFDEWNAVPHGVLRRVRSQFSRLLPAKPEFPALPGSRLVADVMNPLKKQYAFIDLLKPEGAGALPILAALGVSRPRVREIWQFFQRFRQTWAIDFDESGEPENQEYIAAADQSDQYMFDLAEDILAGGSASQISALDDFLKNVGNEISDQARKVRRELLFIALRGSFEIHRDQFDVQKELDKYLVPARTAIASGFQVVVYGHTHAPKRINLGTSAANPSIYLNTGTWADLMRIPDAIWDKEDQARIALNEFIDDLESNSISQWRRSVPTFAKIEVDEDMVVDADIYFADGDKNERVTTKGLMQRLAKEVRDA